MPPSPMLASCEACGGSWLDARYDYAAVQWPQALTHRPTTLWRYEELLPLTDYSFKVSMGEGWSPIIRAEGLGRALGHHRLFIKDERQSPTSSFKDRQGALSVSILKQAGIKECVLASTGNAAAAYAAYCARAGIKLWVFLTSMVPSEKMRELGLYGAEVVKVTGTYDQAKKVAADFAARRGLYLDRGAKGVPGKESMKTLAYEIAEQLGLELADGERWIAPDWYVQAVSGGIGPLGALKGFEELRHMGLIDKMPKLAVVQTEGCAPMVQAFEQGLAEAPAVIPATRITVLSTGDPGQSYGMIRAAILRDGGTMVSVDDGQAFRAMRRVARTEGFSVEPATAVAFAGLEKLLALGYIQPDETVLINCSGHTFPAEKHILEDQYVLDLELGSAAVQQQEEGLGAALERLDEQITTIVIIDDNPQDSRLIRRLLNAYKNYRVFETNNPLDGLDLVRQRRPDLVISDLTMPDMDGFTLLEQLKNDPETAHIPVIVLSAKSLTLADKARLDGRIESVWMKGSFKTRDLVDHVVTTLKDQPPPEVVEPAAVSIPVVTVPSGPRKVLVVDDNPYDSRLVKRILEADRKFSVDEVHSGAGALKAIREIQPDFVILDMILPDMSGLDVLESIRESADIASTKVAILSAKDLNEQERERLNGAAFWQKATLDRRKLVEQVEQQLN
ncbi:MAG: pyridoxal-phosphate dependent enzyme [Anaerolineae bacterium]|nr:pyridoxal-phosphate dependent enzyme [Anaerolineae bacterium]